MKIRVDQNRCIGAGQCVRTAPDVFDQRESDGIVVLLVDAPSGVAADKARKAALLCPSQSIQIDENRTSRETES